MNIAQATALMEQLVTSAGTTEHREAWSHIVPWTHGPSRVETETLSTRRAEWFATYNARVSSLTNNHWHADDVHKFASELATLVHGFKPDGVP